MSDCVLCVAIQSVAEADIVKEAVAKRELTIETMLTAMRDAIVLGWTLRDMQGGPVDLCDGHKEHVESLRLGEGVEGG
jgi:hypothetical protein